MELRGIDTTRRRRPVGAIPPTTLENRVKRFITIDPTIGSRLNLFHEFPEAVFDGVVGNRYDTPTTSSRAITPTTLENRVKWSISIDPTVGSRSNFFHEFPEAIFMELRGIGTTRRRRTVGAIPPTALENRSKRSITIDPTGGSQLNFFHKFSEVVLDGVVGNRYDTPTAFVRGHYTDSAREPGQMVHNYRSDCWIALKCFHEFPEAVFDGVAWNR